MSAGELYPRKELRKLQQTMREKTRKQQQEGNARERKSRKPSAADDSSALSAEPDAGEHTGGAGSGKSPAPGTGSVGSALNAEPGAGGYGGGAGRRKSPASRAADDCDCEIVEAGAGELEGGAKTLRGKTLRLKQDDPPLLVKHMSPGESCQVSVKTEILLQNLDFLKHGNIASSFDKERMLVNITALDWSSVESDFATIQFVHTLTGKVIGTIWICNKTSSVSTLSQKSDTDRRAHLRTLGLEDVPDNALESEIKKAYYKKILPLHPDKTGDSSEEAMEKYYAVQRAYTALTRKD